MGATSWTDDPEELVGKCMACPGYAWVAGLDRPIVVIGGVPMWPGVWSMFMFATNEISNIGLGLTKFVARRMIPGLLDQGAHRLEARSMDGHVDAQSWLETFGAAREATLYGYGRGDGGRVGWGKGGAGRG